MRWISWWNFVRNAVKSGDLFFFTAFTEINAFLTKIHRIHRISYKKISLKPRPGRTCLHWGHKNQRGQIKKNALIYIENINFKVMKNISYPPKLNFIAMTRNLIKHGISYSWKITKSYRARKHQDLCELVWSFHGYQETRSQQDFQEILTMTWQVIQNCKN